MMTVAITGRSGCGKSTVTAQFVAAGISVVDADQISRDILTKGSPCLPKLQSVFGDDICTDGVLNRRLLADRAFATAEGTTALNDITHPEIIARICVEKQKAQQAQQTLFAIDGAVIFDTPCEAECDAFLVVTAPYEQSVARIVARDGIAPEMAMRRLDTQTPEHTLVARADYLIENTGTLETLLQQTQQTIANLWRDANATKAPR